MAVVNTEMEVSKSMDYLQSLLSPLSAMEFLRSDWGERFVQLDGTDEKFSHLFSWELLNNALESYPLCPPRMTLCRSGEQIAPKKFMSSHALSDRGTDAWLKATDLMNELGSGATLVLKYADELSEPLRNLTVRLEEIFHTYINVNLYAAFRTDNGLSLHWDDQDTLILQVIGRKRWVIFEPTRIHPLREDRRPVPRPSAPPVWEGILNQGGLLHIPRGWLHVAYPLDQPSLHLTFTVQCATGLDFLRWFVSSLCKHAELRANLPLWAGSEDQRLRLNVFKRQLIDEWERASIDRFVDDRDAMRVRRPHVTLPEC
jgi:hypothetical protein